MRRRTGVPCDPHWPRSRVPYLWRHDPRDGRPGLPNMRTRLRSGSSRMRTSRGPAFRWFAWRPVWTGDRGWRWMRPVWRRRAYLDIAGLPAYASFENSVSKPGSTGVGLPKTPTLGRLTWANKNPYNPNRRVRSVAAVWSIGAPRSGGSESQMISEDGSFQVPLRSVLGWAAGYAKEDA